VDLVKFSSSLP